MGYDVKGDRHNPAPLAAGKKKNVNKNSVGEPKGIENKMPPAGQPDRMPDSRQAEPTGQGDRVLFRMVFAVEGNGAKEAEPFRARSATWV